MATPHLLALCGGLRTGAFNKKLLDIAVAEARRQGAEVDVVEPKSLGQLPIVVALVSGPLTKLKG